MESQVGFIENDNGKLHYLILGNGKLPLLCFHGYGQSKEDLIPLAHPLGNHYTLYLFDLFYHGESVWYKVETLLQNHDLALLFEVFLRKHDMNLFSLLGYSMGGKLAFSLLQHFSARVKDLFLIAPDGVKNNAWYTLGTSTVVGRTILKTLTSHPTKLKKISLFFSSIGIISKKIPRFATRQLQTEAQRKRVYHTWSLLRSLRSDIPLVTEMINRNNIQVYVFLGRYDSIIKPADIHFFVNKLKSCKLYLLKSGHSNLLTFTAEFLNEKQFSF